MYLYELYKDLYYNEMQERRYYDDRINFTLALLTAMATAIVYLITQDGKNCIIRVLIVISMMVFALQIIYAFKAYFSWKYKYYDFPVDKIEESIKSHYTEKQYSKKEIKELASEEWIYGMLSRTYATCCGLYYKQNLKKRKAHHLLNLISYINLCIILLTFIVIQIERG